MAEAMTNNSRCNLTYLTDCMFFIAGHCKSNENCRYRHCREAIAQRKNCPKWPNTCRSVTCSFRHPATAAIPLVSSVEKRSLVSFFWDIENVPIPKGHKPFDIVKRIRQKLVIEPGLQEADFSCYCNSSMISEANLISLHHANVRIVHIPDRKPGAADRQIMLDLNRFERVHRPPATIVLISGDIDFVGTLSGLRHQAGFHVIVIHNKPAKTELKATVNEHYSWELFTLQDQQLKPADVANGLEPVNNDRISRTVQTNRTRHSSRHRSARRRDPSLSFASRQQQQQPLANNSDVKRLQCPVCSAAFDSIESLRQHQNAKKHLFDCPLCKESFLLATALTQHQNNKKHYVLDYKCHQCNHYFAKIESLKQHQQDTAHILSSIETPDPKKMIRSYSSSAALSDNDHGINEGRQDPVITILEGIEAIKQFYGKQFVTNK